MVDPIIPAPMIPIRMIRSDAATNRDGSQKPSCHETEGTAENVEIAEESPEREQL
jgi:hypothetical protein